MKIYEHKKISEFTEIVVEEFAKDSLTTKDAYWIAGHGKDISEYISKQAEKMALVTNGVAKILPESRVYSSDNANQVFLKLRNNHYCCSSSLCKGISDFQLATTYATTEDELRGKIGAKHEELSTYVNNRQFNFAEGLIGNLRRLNDQLNITDDDKPIENYKYLDLRDKIVILTSPGSLTGNAEHDLREPINLSQTYGSKHEGCFENRLRVFDKLLKEGSSGILGLCDSSVVIVKPYDEGKVKIQQYNF